MSNQCQHTRLQDKVGLPTLYSIMARCVDCGMTVILHINSTEIASANGSVTISPRYPAHPASGGPASR
jgi:hypothetical protein